MSDYKAAATNFLNALDRIPKLMEQYKTENEKLEKDLPTLREVVGGTWKKEKELKQLKSEVAALERKIQLSLVPPEQSGKGDMEQKQDKKKFALGWQQYPVRKRPYCHSLPEATCWRDFKRDKIVMMLKRWDEFHTTADFDTGI